MENVLVRLFAPVALASANGSVNRFTKRREFLSWASRQSKDVQRLIREFPLGTKFYRRTDNDAVVELMFLIGWTDGDTLIVSLKDPQLDYKAARAECREMPADEIRKGEVKRL